ncbi:hypothetical protein M0R19_08875 [Candidatus Pacearchaeota archaeon]|jgi:hypothetical protein|nr:hypothetical protein [Candidatus Pacearchaeota archaeon]
MFKKNKMDNTVLGFLRKLNDLIPASYDGNSLHKITLNFHEDTMKKHPLCLTIFDGDTYQEILLGEDEIKKLNSKMAHEIVDYYKSLKRNESGAM